MRVALGIDLSLSATGLVAVPFDWGGDWSRVARATYGKPLKQHASQAQVVERLNFIARNMGAFAEKFHCTDAIMEQYAFSSQSSRAHALGELGGALKRECIARGLDLHAPVPPASARAVLGKMPRKGSKDAAHVILHNECGCPVEWTPDECDAFIATNYKLTELGGFAYILRDPSAEKTKSKKKSGGRRAA